MNDLEKPFDANSIQHENFILQKKLTELSMRIGLLRNMMILLGLFVVILMIPAFSIHKILNDELKIWLIGVVGFAFIALFVALFLARNDSTTTLFVTSLLTVISCTILGIVMCSLQKIISGT